MKRPIASLSLDLDDAWSYLKTRGDPGWEALPSFLPIVVPRFLDVLKRHGLRITVFVVGQDAVLERNGALLNSIVDAGHEIGCHSFRHEPWLHRYSRAELESELSRATAAIEAATGIRPSGFRGPGYSLSRDTLEALAALGYRYDCTTLPTFIGPFARWYYFRTAGIGRRDRTEREALFGKFSDGLRPLRPYVWNLGSQSIVEIPVTTFPLFRTPIHFSYVLYIAQIASQLAPLYFKAALRACRLAGIAPSLLLHPLDFLCADDVPALAFFPAMRLSLERKLAVVDRALSALTGAFDVIPVGEHAELWYNQNAECAGQPRAERREESPGFTGQRAG